MARARRLKRATSRSIRQNPGRTVLARWANTLPIELPFHTTPVRSSVTEKLMSVGAESTPSSPRSWLKPGYVGSLKTMKPVSTSCVSSARSILTVFVWPPGRSSASNTVTSCTGASTWAHVSPEIPVPTMAIRTGCSSRDVRLRLAVY